MPTWGELISGVKDINLRNTLNGDGLNIFNRNQNQSAQTNNTVDGQRKLGLVGRTMAGMSDVGDAIYSLSGFDKNWSEFKDTIKQGGGLGNGGLANLTPMQTVNTAGSFLASLPLGMASAIPSGIPKMYEAATGIDVMDATEKNDQGERFTSSTPLTQEQRIGAGIDGIIDTAGLMAGATGRVLSAASRASGTGARVMKGLADGDRLIDKATRANYNVQKALRGPEVESTAARIAWDMGTEGTEEFIQSYGGDARHENLNEGSLGRALEAAALGAVGGGIMSGGFEGLRRLNKKLEGQKPDRTSSAANIDPNQIPTQTDPLNDPNRWNGQDHTYISEIQNGAKETEYEKAAGTAPTLLIYSNDNLRPDQVSVTAAYFRTLLRSADENTLTELRDKFFPDLDKGRLYSLIEQGCDVANIKRAQAACDELFKYYNQTPLWADKYPTARTMPMAPMKIGSIEPGRTARFGTNPMVTKLFNMDMDGDKPVLSIKNGIGMDRLDPENDSIWNYVVDPITGKANLDQDYTYINYGLKDSAIRDSLRNLGINDNAVLDEVTALYKDLVNGSKDVEDEAQFIYKVYNALKSAGHADVMSEFVFRVQTGNDISISTIRSTINNAKNALKNVGEDLASRAVDPDAPTYNQQLPKDIGHAANSIIAATTSDKFEFSIGGYGTVLFRAFGPGISLVLNRDISNGVDWRVRWDNIREQEMLANSHLAGIGVQVVKELQGVYKNFVLQEALTSIATVSEKQNSWYTSEGFNQWLNSDFKDAVITANKAYNESIEQEGFGVEDFISKEAMTKKNENPSDDELFSIMIDAFGDIPAQFFFQNQSGLTLSEFLTANMSNRFATTSEILKSDNDRAGWESYIYDKAISSAKRRFEALDNSIDNTSEHIVNKFKHEIDLSDFEKGWGPGREGKYDELFGSLSRMIGPDNCVNIGWGLTSEVFTDPRTKAMIDAIDSGNPELLKNLTMSYRMQGMAGDFKREYMSALCATTAEERIAALNRAEREISKFYGDSKVWNTIISETMINIDLLRVSTIFSEDGTTLPVDLNEFVNYSKAYAFLTNTNNDWAAKEAYYTEFIGFRSNTVSPLAASMFEYNSNDAVHLSQMKQDIARAHTMASNVARIYGTEAMNDIRSGFAALSERLGNIGGIVDFLDKQTSIYSSTPNIDNLADMAWTQRHVNSKKRTEKSTVEQASANFSAAMYIGSGRGLVSDWQIASGEIYNVMSAERWGRDKRAVLNVVFGRDSYRLSVDNKEGFIVMDQKKLFDSVGIEIDENGPTDQQLMDLMLKIPELRTYMVPSSTTTIDDQVQETYLKSFNDAVQFYCNNNDSSLDIKYQIRNTIEQEILGNPEVLNEISFAVDSMYDDPRAADFDRKDFREKFRKAYDDVVQSYFDAIVWKIQHPNNNDKIDYGKNDMLKNISNHFKIALRNDITDAVKKARLMFHQTQEKLREDTVKDYWSLQTANKLAANAIRKEYKSEDAINTWVNSLSYEEQSQLATLMLLGSDSDIFHAAAEKNLESAEQQLSSAIWDITDSANNDLDIFKIAFYQIGLNREVDVDIDLEQYADALKLCNVDTSKFRSKVTKKEIIETMFGQSDWLVEIGTRVDVSKAAKIFSDLRHQFKLDQITEEMTTKEYWINIKNAKDDNGKLKYNLQTKFDSTLKRIYSNIAMTYIRDHFDAQSLLVNIDAFDTADRVVNNRMNFVRQFVESPKNGETDKFAEFRTKVQSLDVRSDLSKVSFVNIDPVRGFGTYIGQQTGYEAYAGITPIQIGLNGTDQPRLASLSVLVDPQGRYGSCGSSGTHSTIGTIKRSYNKKGNSDYAGMSIRMNDAEFQNLVNSQSNPTLKRSLKLSSKRSANGDIIVKLNPDVMTVFNSDNTIDNISVEIMSPMQCTDPLNCADHNVMSYTASGNSVAVHTNSSAGFLGYFNVWESVIKNGMEAMLLKAKKKYDPEKSTSIYRGASKRSKELVSTSLSGNLSASDIMDNQTMLDAFNKNREAQVKRWMQIFDDCGLKDYDRCHAEAIVSVECPGIYVQYSDGTHHVITLQQMKDPQTYAEQIAPLDGATIISVDALVLSFQEVSNKADRALLNFGQNVTDISDLRISMRNYMNDWSTWSTKIPSRNTNILTVEDCVGKIRGLRKYHKNIKATDDLQDPTTSLREKLFPGRPNVDVYATQELNRFVEKANEYNANASKNSSHSRDFISNFYQDCRKALDGFNGSVDDLIEKGFGFTNMSYVKDQKNKYDVGKSYNKSWSDKYIYNANNLFIKIDSLPGELREFEEQEIIQSIREALSNGRNIIVRDTYTSTIQNILLENDMIPSGIDIDHVVKVGGYAKFNISESIAEYGRAHNVIYIPAIHEVKADPFMMSTPNWKNAPDAGSKFRLSFFNDNNIVFGRHEKFGVNEKISSYFQQAVGNNYAFSLVKNTDELNGLAANSSNMTYLKYNTVSSKYNMNYLRSSVKDYLKYVKTHGFNSYMAGMSQGSCVGIVKREIPGEETIYAPIILVDDKFRGENNTIDFDIALCDNGQLAYSYSRIIQPMPGDQVKSNSVGTGNKHIGSFSTDNNEFSVVSCPFYKDGHIIPGHMFDRQSQTIDGKLKGMTKRNMWCNLQNGAIDAGLSIWIDPKTGKAKNTLSEDVVKLVDDLMQGQTKAYKKLLLISNFFNTSEPIDIEQTNAIKRAITLAQQWRVMEMNRFTSKCRLINGEIIKNDTTADYSPIYDIMSEHDLLLFFNAFDSRLCPRGIYDPCTNNHFFDHNGCVLYFNPTTEKYERVICHFEEPNMFDPGPGIQFSGRATMSDQAFVNNISAYGIHPEDMQRLLSIIAKHHGDIDYRNAAVRAANKQIKAEMLPIQRTPNNTAMDVYNKIIDRSTPATRMMYSRFIKTINTIAKHRVNIVENTKTNDPTPQAEIAKLTQKLNDAYRYSSTDPRCFTDDDTLKIFEQSIAWSYDEDGNANNWSISTMEESINKIVSRVRFTEEFVLPIQHLDSTCNRFANPILSRDVWQKILDSPKYQNQYDENYLHERLENEWEETNKYWQQQLNKSSDVAQLRAIEDNAIALMLNNGMYDVASTSITGYMSTAEWINYDNEMLDVINFSDPNLRQAWYEQQQHDFKQATRMKLAVMTIEQQRADNGPNSNAVSKKHPQTAATSMMYNMSALGKTMALINPELALGNGLDTLVKTGYSRNMIKMAELGVGPIVMDQKLDLDWNIIKTAARDHNFRRIMSIFKRSRVEGKGIVNASEYKSPTEFLKAINDAENKSVIEKVWDKTATFASAGDIFTTQEGENFISYVIIKAMQQGHTWLLEDSGVPVNNEPGARNMTMIEYQLSQDPGKWLFDLLKAENNADYIMGQQALNSALRGTMANRNLLSMIYEHLMDGHAATELLFTSCFCRFFQYSTNFTMNIMNWVAPMSSIHHLATRYVMTWGTNADGKRIKRWVLKDGTKRSEIAKGIAAEAETLLTESSLKEALMHDAIKMSTGIMAMAIFGLAAFEPPEDDEGNVDLQRIWNVEEWTIFGHRIQAAWWIQDTIGLALPMAAAMKASSLGYPNVKILTHGLQKAIAINPMVNIGELVKSIYDPTYQMPDYSYDLENNKSDRDAGGLDKMEWLADSGSALTLSWFSQFVTPSFLKEWYQAGQEFEASIKYVQATDAQGNPVVGADGNPIYERTTAHDRSLRALSKKNPIIGWFLDKIKDPAEGSGYMASEMPRTVYYDQVQREMMAKYSCYTTDENGETVLKEGADLQSSILQIIGELQSYEDMGELAETGFYLDYNTKAYMSKFIWDYINQLKDAYYDGYNYGEFSEWALGYGLYDYGKEKASEIQQSYWDEINYWKSFYYDKLWSSDLKKQMVEYNRQNTIYLQDADGNYYASGILNNKSPLLPFKVASDPDDITSNKDTSWATYSALTGQAMFDDNNNPTRALVPMQEDYYETPDLESWEGYDPSDPTSWQGDTSSSNSYGSGKSTGGGYYYSSGGSSYSPKIYSRNRNPYQKTSNVMQSSKPYKTNYDYLKPVVDKKGSKDPQRRSDF